MTPTHRSRRSGRSSLPGALIALAVLAAGCSAQPAGATAESSVEASGPGCPTAQPAPLAAGASRVVTITTDLGAIVITVKADLSPIAVGNFVALAECGFYDGVVFHRVVPEFVIQGGDPTGTGSGGPGYTITDETVTSQYSRGTVAMARTAQPNSVGSQFFIVLDDSARTPLAGANTYQIIGTVTSGMEIADAILAAADGELPSDPVVMTDVSVTTP